MNLFMNITTEIKIFLKMRNLFFLSSVISDLEKSLCFFGPTVLLWKWNQKLHVYINIEYRYIKYDIILIWTSSFGILFSWLKNNEK